MKKYRHLVSIVCVMITGSAFALTNYVVEPGTPGVTPTSPFTSWSTAATNIQDAVSVVGSGGLVLVTNGTHYVTNQITITQPITIRSFNNGSVDREGTIISGGYPDRINRCFYVNNVAATFDGLTITGGFAAGAAPDGRGGGIYLDRNGTVTNCLITGNSAENSGGGMAVLGSGVLVIDTIVTANAATNATASEGGWGGGLYMSGGTLRNCTISDNRSGFQAGGLYMYTGGGLITNCTIAGNVAQPLPGVGGGSGYGGALWAGWSGTIVDCTIVSNRVGPSTSGSGLGGAGVYPGNGMIVRDCLIAYNSTIGGGGYGGGITCGNGRTVSNCIIRNNSAANGGGVYPSPNGLLVNCTIVSNSSAAFCDGGIVRNCLFAENGSGVSVYNGETWFENCTITDHSGVGISFRKPGRMENCIVAGNNSGGANWSYVTGTDGTNTVWTNSCTYPLPTGGFDVAIVTNLPRFVDAAVGDFRLKGSSPCIDQGIFRDWMTGAKDLGGAQRIIALAVDMGAYEAPLPPGTLITIR